LRIRAEVLGEERIERRGGDGDGGWGGGVRDARIGGLAEKGVGGMGWCLL